MSAHAIDFIDYSYDVYVAALQTNSAKEIVYRTIINRSYYGAFLTARDYAGITGKYNMHTRVIYYYKNNNLRTISDNLMDLKVLRQAADYNLYSDINMELAKTSYSHAYTIIKLISDMPPRLTTQARTTCPPGIQLKPRH